MTLHSLPVFVRLQGRAVILVGVGETADAKRRLLERAGAVVIDEDGASIDASAATASDARLAIVVDDEAAVARLKARGILVNAVDRPELCDFTLPAIVDRDPVIVAIGTGGASAGLAAALRQRLEMLIPVSIAALARGLYAARPALRARWPEADARRRALARGMAPGGALDPLGAEHDIAAWIAAGEEARGNMLIRITLRSGDPDDLTLREARALAQADRVSHAADVPPGILNRARADAPRIQCGAPPGDAAGLTVDVRFP